MPDILNSIFTSSEGTFTFLEFCICVFASLMLGLVTSLAFRVRSRFSRGFTMTLVILPAAVCVVIMLVNGNLGAGVAVAGAFSLVRFRSAQGSAREICAIFVAMAIGLATGMGYVGAAALFTAITALVVLALVYFEFGERRASECELRITTPEGMDYRGAFDEVFERFTKSHELMNVKTTNMGSLFRLKYAVTMKPGASEKEFIDALRTKNGNLEISLGLGAQIREESL